MTKEREKVIAVVEKAKAYIQTNGKERSIVEFNKKFGQFSKNDSYIFAVDYKGSYLATVNYPNLIGTNQFNLKDPTHVFLAREQVEKAKAGGGWIQGRLKKNPQTGKYECKESYILPMPGDYFIGSGYYYPPNKEGNCKNNN